jgi:hypothetical protein
MKVSKHSSDEFPELILEPVESEPLEIYYVTGTKDQTHGPLDLKEFEEVLPELHIYDTYIFYRGLTEWKSLAELEQKYLSAG